MVPLNILRHGWELGSAGEDEGLLHIYAHIHPTLLFFALPFPLFASISLLLTFFSYSLSFLPYFHSCPPFFFFKSFSPDFLTWADFLKKISFFTPKKKRAKK